MPPWFNEGDGGDCEGKFYQGQWWHNGDFKVDADGNVVLVGFVYTVYYEMEWENCTAGTCRDCFVGVNFCDVCDNRFRYLLDPEIG